MDEIIFFEPIFKERIWGGNNLKTSYGYNIESNYTGECWAVSAHGNGETIVRGGLFSGIKLSELWNNYPELFAVDTNRNFPLLIKILDAKTDLSVQVHPSDEYAKKVENDLGKAECWYVLDAGPNAKIVYGLNIHSKAEFKYLVAEHDWDKLLNTIPVKAGDFFDLSPGTVHALGAGTLALEIQQSSDTTYRIYDYDRKDAEGNLRELHLDKALDVIDVNAAPKHIGESKKINANTLYTLLTENDYFQVAKLEINGESELKLSVPYLLISVIDGYGTINNQQVKKGDHLLIPNQIRNLVVDGYLKLILSNEVTY